MNLDFERLITGNVPALLSFFDAEHVCRYANQHHCDWYGRSPAELVGLHMRDFVGEEAYLLRRRYLKLVAQGERVSFEGEVPHRDGSWRQAAIRYVPHLADGRFAGFFILVVDIAPQLHRYHRVFDATAVAFWEIDVSNVAKRLADLAARGVEDPVAYIRGNLGFIRKTLDETEVLDLNRRAETMFEISRDEALRTPFGRWCPTDSEPVLRDNLVAFITGEPGFEAETCMTRSDGTRFSVHLSLAYPDQIVGPPAATLAIMDISERIGREQALARANADLAHAARIATLGELTASIAHEVNQPLAAVVANGNAALRWLKRGTPDLTEATAAIQRMIDEGTRASEIILRTRRMAIKELGERTATSVTETIIEAVAIVRRQLADLGAELAIRLAEDVPLVCADRVQLQQVIINLVVNAAQAMAEGGGSQRRIDLECSVADGVIVVEVADTGPGFDDERASQIFNAFYTTKPTGMGIGLSVSKTIIEAHGGIISAKSREGGGARFRFELPLGQQTSKAPSNSR